MEKEIFKKLKSIEERLGKIEENYAKLTDFLLPNIPQTPKQIKDLPADVLSKTFSDFNFSQRAINHLSNGNIHIIGDLVSYSKHDLLKIRNLGLKTIRELESLYEKLGVVFNHS